MANEIIRNLKKDLAIELRNRTALSLTLSFAGVSTLSVSLVAGGTSFQPLVLSILLWIIIFFSSMSGLAHIFIREEEERTALFLKSVSTADGVFIGKTIFNILFFAGVETVILPLFLFFLQVEVVNIPFLVAIVYTGGIAISSATTMLGALAARAGGRSSLFTVISFPLILPVLWVAVGSTRRALEGGPADWQMVLFFLAFSGVLVSVSLLLFPYLWHEE